MARKYHTLITKIDGQWFPQFGDYDKEVVKQEAEDSYDDRSYYKAVKIITTAPDQASIEAAIAKLNAQ